MNDSNIPFIYSSFNQFFLPEEDVISSCNHKIFYLNTEANLWVKLKIEGDTNRISYVYENDYWVETATPLFKRSPVVVNHSPTIERNKANDRVIPMETVTIQSSRREKSAEVEKSYYTHRVCSR